jgi:hypothetical protein
MSRVPTGPDTSTGDGVLRGRLIAAAAVVAGLATLHFADHVIRGWLVTDRGLDPAWNHSGWPFQPRITPFTISLLLVYALLLGGIFFTRRGQLWAGYWLGAAIVLGAIVTQVHFVPGPNTEYPSVIVDTYGSPAAGIPAVIIVLAIVAALVFMAGQAIWVRRLSGRW